MIYSLSWLMWIIIPSCFYVVLSKRGWIRKLAFALLVPFVLLFYGRFIEPNLLLVERHSFPAPFKIKIALIGDVHVGLFSSDERLSRLIERLNALDVDEVWVAGDWTYLPPFDMKTVFSVWSQLRHPVFSVPGNHDAQRPGPPLQQSLRRALQDNGVEYLENTIEARDGFSLLGLGSAWALEAHYQLVHHVHAKSPLLVLAHNPDVANFFPKPAFLTLAGHTHGGQVDLPWLTQRVLSKVTMAGVKEGWYQTPNGPMFVTRGIGMVGLPVRFRSVPVIDVIELYPGAPMPLLQDATVIKGRFGGW
ncbi:MAG: metallophosphoesterase [Granulosicoccaceae bacterium]